MHSIFSYAIDQLQNYGSGLAMKAVLVGKPWTQIEKENNIQKLIFKNNGELIISKNGDVVKGKWEYFSQANSLLIDRGDDKFLYNEGFIDEAALVLKKDGTSNQFFVLANENKLPNLDVIAYLTGLKYQKMGVVGLPLKNNEEIEVHGVGGTNLELIVGLKVTRNLKDIDDGIFYLKNENKQIHIKKSRISKIAYLLKYSTKCGKSLVIEQEGPHYYQKGEYVTWNGKPAPDGRYEIVNGVDIKVSNGHIKKIPWF